MYGLLNYRLIGGGIVTYSTVNKERYTSISNINIDNSNTNIGNANKKSINNKNASNRNTNNKSANDKNASNRNIYNRSMLARFKLQAYKQIFVLMGILFLFVFSYIPMTGIIIAFKNYKLASGFLGFFTSEWVGFKYFIEFFRV